MKSIIFGGEGFIGRHLAANLLSGAGEESVISVDLAESERREGGGRTFRLGDVRNALLALDLRPSTPTTIFNLAAVHRTPGHPEREYFETNLLGAENVCNFAREHGVRTIVFASSIAPYGASEPLKTEETLPLPNTAYGISKLVAEHIHRTWQAERCDERRLVIVRPGVVFGPGEGGNFTRLARVMRRGRFVYPGRVDTIKACIYVKDVARLMVEMAERREPGVYLYNLTVDPAPTIQEICQTLARVMGVDEPRMVLPGQLLKFMAACLGPLQPVLGEGFHPDRVRKLMVSNNICGKRLVADGYSLRFTLEQALNDWRNDCGGNELQ